MKKDLLSWLSILLGCTIMAAGFVFFINPYNIVPGGVYGASIVLHNLFPSIQVGTFGYLLDVPLLILSVVLLGSKLGSRTLVAALSTPFIMNALSWLAYPSESALQALDPTQIAGGTLDLSNHLMLTTLMGAVVVGVGDMHIKFSSGILLVDGIVVGLGLLVIGFGLGGHAEGSQPSWMLSFYSLIAIYVISRVLSRVINGSKNDKLLFVISDLKLEELHRYILHHLDRTATCIKSSGLYTQREKQMIFLVVSYKEVAGVKQVIKEADPRAFVVVTDAYDTYGEGWKQLPDKGEIQPE